jgi:hypothetical protein
MPKKSRRVAARQAELGQRKRRAPKHQSHPEPLPAPTPQDEGVALLETLGATVSSKAPAPAVPRLAPQQHTSRIVRSRSVSPYTWPEIKRIGLLSGLIFGILAVLTIFLR